MDSSMAAKYSTSALRYFLPLRFLHVLSNLAAKTNNSLQIRSVTNVITSLPSTAIVRFVRLLHRTCGRDEEGETGAQWSDLPHELLMKIANDLDIISLLRFRSVCRDWNSATDSLSAEIESSPGKKPWLLSYLENSDESFLLDGSGKCYRLKTPELNGANCIASRDGWLLVLKNDSVFFFCPFSHAKIELPKLPTAEFSHCLGAFLDAPTSQDCIVSVICQNEASFSELTLYFIRRGEKAWNHETLKRWPIRKIRLAACFGGKFMFFDNAWNCFKFNPSKFRWRRYSAVAHSDNPKARPIPFKLSRGSLSEKEVEMVKEGLELGGEVDVFVKICGVVFAAGEGDDKMTFVIGLERGDRSKCSGVLKGVWVQPRLFSVAGDFTW